MNYYCPVKIKRRKENGDIEILNCSSNSSTEIKLDTIIQYCDLYWGK